MIEAASSQVPNYETEIISGRLHDDLSVNLTALYDELPVDPAANETQVVQRGHSKLRRLLGIRSIQSNGNTELLIPNE